MTTIALISCSATKAPSACQARYFYQGALFKICVLYSELVLKVPWFVLSAKLGLVAPDQIVEPYDVALKNMSRSQCDRWDSDTREQIWTKFGAELTVVFLGSEVYSGCIRSGWKYEEPCKGMGIGVRMGYLKSKLLEHMSTAEYNAHFGEFSGAHHQQLLFGA